jgi:acetyl-CoA C-acetyltransferase
VDLGGLAIKAPLEKSGISGDQVDYVIMGQVIQARPARTPPGRRRSRMVSR